MALEFLEKIKADKRSFLVTLRDPHSFEELSLPRQQRLSKSFAYKLRKCYVSLSKII